MDDVSTGPDETLFCHEGEISLAQSEAMFGEMLSLARSGRIPRSAFRVFVELVQNIRLHGGASGSVSVVSSGELVIVRARNTVPNADAEKVRGAVDYANQHAGNLAKVMREIRSSPVPDGSKGAGLGLFEIRRQSWRDIALEINSADHGNSWLVITVSLKHKSTP